jgi:hypothetical protein
LNAQSRCRRRTRALLERRGPFAALAISTTVAACTTNPIRHVRSTYELTKTGSTEVQTETDLIEVGVQDRIGPDLEYRVSDKFVYGAQKLDTGSTSTYDESTLHRPSSTS